MERLPANTVRKQLREAVDAQKLDQMVVAQEVETSQFGSLEALAYYVMVEQPHLAEADPTTVANHTGLSLKAVTYLWHSSREFQALLDWHVVGAEWNLAERRQAYRTMKTRIHRDAEKFSDVIRAVEYFDRKTNTAPEQAQMDRGGTTVQVAIVHQGSSESDYRPLRFGQTPTSRQVARAGRTLSPDEGLVLVEAVEGESGVPQEPGATGDGGGGS